MTITKQQILAGTDFTIHVPNPGPCQRGSYAFRVEREHGQGDDDFRVSLLVAATGTRMWCYLGDLDRTTGEVALGARTFLRADSFCVKLLGRVLARVWADDLAAVLKHGYKVSRAA